MVYGDLRVIINSTCFFLSWFNSSCISCFALLVLVTTGWAFFFCTSASSACMSVSHFAGCFSFDNPSFFFFFSGLLKCSGTLDLRF